MILRTIRPSGSLNSSGGGAWSAFVPSQATDASILGCISQPAHAALAGRLARVLNGQLFDEVPEEVIETIESHDAGWSQIDLAALENAPQIPPISFVSASSVIAVQAWRRSIAEAETKSALSAYAVTSHFCLLAPRDEDAEHLFFLEEQQARVRRSALASKYPVQDLERFVAFLGFCDLLSLHLCSGWPGDIKLPLAHPAHPSSKEARTTPVSIDEGFVQLNKTNIGRGTIVYVDGWERTQSGGFQNQRYEWIVQ
jgi:hypothetical protein